MSSFNCDIDLNSKISFWKGSIYSLAVDAIGNSTDHSLSGSGCLDSVIHYFAGDKLREECLLLDECPMGQVAITRGYDLPTKYILHCVGPSSGDPHLLASCYHSALDIAVEHGISTIAFPCVATGLNSFPLEVSAQVVLQTTRRWLEKNNNRDKIQRIIFVFWRNEEEVYYSKWMPSVFPLPSTLTYRDALEGDTKPLIKYWVKSHSILDPYLYTEEEFIKDKGESEDKAEFFNDKGESKDKAEFFNDKGESKDKVEFINDKGESKDKAEFINDKGEFSSENEEQSEIEESGSDT
jgi:O-acetyl-ADP-ribose deacetylase (regulator of RNase III)